MTEKNAERLKRIKIASSMSAPRLNNAVALHDYPWRTIHNDDYEWLIEQAERADELEGAFKAATDIIIIAGSEVRSQKEENKKLTDQLNYVKKLVTSERVAHKVKYDLQLMFREESK